MLCLVGIPALFYACLNTPETQHNGWNPERLMSKTIDSVTFTFPADTYAFQHKDVYISQCLEAMEANLDLLEFKNWQQPFNIWFCKDRDEIYRFTGTASGGSAHPFNRTLYVVANQEEEPPISHELMHLIPMLEWGYTPPSVLWLNEGLATFSENNCHGFTVAQIYRYMLDHDHLIPMESLAENFYAYPEMLAYHQSGYVAQYLLENFGIKKFEQLWRQGFEAFESIYGSPFSEVESLMNQSVLLKHPEAPEIDWERFMKGCS
ncbi:MAG: hypothetical protein AAFP76_03295 [Bacteroidota bacterium]